MLGINLTKRVQDLYAKAAGGRSDRGLRELEGPTAPGTQRAMAKTPAHPSPLPRFHAAPAKTPAGLCADTDRAALKPRDVQANHRTPNHGREQSSGGSVTQFYSFRYNHRSRAAWVQAQDPAGRTRHKRDSGKGAEAVHGKRAVFSSNGVGTMDRDPKSHLTQKVTENGS